MTRAVPFAEAVTRHLVGRTDQLAEQWLVELRKKLFMSPRRIFPDATLLNHIPVLLRSLLEAVIDSEVTLEENSFVQSELKKLADLRRVQGYTLKEIISEFQLLGDLVLSDIEAEASRFPEPVSPAEVIRFARRLQSALGTLTFETSEAYLEAASHDHRARAELISTFGRAVTHELRNRLNNALLALDVFRQRVGRRHLDADASSLLERLERTLHKMEGVATDVFAATVTENRPEHAAGRRQPFDELVREVLAEVAAFGARRRVELHWPDEMPCFQVDAARLQLVLVNLINNAIKYADPEKSRRHVSLRVSRTAAEAEWRIDLIDNGIGIPDRFQNDVFIRNVRAADSDEAGEGLGLALAREAVAQMGGRLWLSSVKGEGSAFSFTLREPAAELTVLQET